MTPLIQNGQTIFDAIITCGAIVYLVANVVKGRSDKHSSDESDALTTIRLKDESIKELRSQLGNLQNQLIEDGKQIAVLQADNKRLEALVTNRSPQLEAILNKLVDGQKQILDAIHNKPSTTVINQPA